MTDIRKRIEAEKKLSRILSRSVGMTPETETAIYDAILELYELVYKLEKRDRDGFELEEAK